MHNFLFQGIISKNQNYKESIMNPEKVKIIMNTSMDMFKASFTGLSFYPPGCAETKDHDQCKSRWRDERIVPDF
jgi:hypothetical protein